MAYYKKLYDSGSKSKYGLNAACAGYADWYIRNSGMCAKNPDACKKYKDTVCVEAGADTPTSWNFVWWQMNREMCRAGIWCPEGKSKEWYDGGGSSGGSSSSIVSSSAVSSTSSGGIMDMIKKYWLYGAIGIAVIAGISYFKK